MESIGDTLKDTRLSKKLSLRDIAKTTNINQVYLEALEEEQFDRFPSETYLIGFLRNYAEYLKLDVDAIIQAYKGHKIGESVTPLKELTKPTRSAALLTLSSLFNKYRNILFIAGITIAAVLVIWGIQKMVSSDVDVSSGESIEQIKEEYSASHESDDIENIRTLQLTNNSGFTLVYKKEAVQFLVDKKEVVFLLKEIKDNSVELEFIPGRMLKKFTMDTPGLVKLKGFPREITITLKGLTDNRAKIMVNLGKELKSSETAVVKENEAFTSEDNTSVIAQNNKNLKIIFEAKFVQKSFIELYLDGNRKKRGFVQAGSVERWEASEYIQIKIGNAGGLNIRINGRPYVFGKSGQIANKVITWKKDVKNPNLYHIVVKDW